MPELPEIQAYLEALEARARGRPVGRVAVTNPFVLRTVDPPVSSLEGKTLVALRRMGKRIVLEFEGELFAVIHLMIAGRLGWKASPKAVPPRKAGLAAIGFPNGTLILTEAGTKRRASLHVVRGPEALGEFDPGGLEVLDASGDEFAEALRRENHTLKRALTDPRLLSGVGNAYSDEILLAAGLSPLKLSRALDDAEVGRLYRAVRETLAAWTGRLRERLGGRFPEPEDIAALRRDFAVHGRFRQPCPRCGTAIQRIRYAECETSYCPRCQTDGKVLADRSLSRLLKRDWPRTIEELESRSASRGVR